MSGDDNTVPLTDDEQRIVNILARAKEPMSEAEILAQFAAEVKGEQQK